MFVLHVLIQTKPGQAEAAEQVFAGPFKAAISAQPGFGGVQFLRSRDGAGHVLSIAFADQTQQQQWVATPLHGQVWTEMEQHFAGYSLATFDAV